MLENQKAPGENPFLPSSSLVFALGLLSIALCWLYGIAGLMVGIAALKLSKMAISTNQQGIRYEEKAMRKILMGRTCAVIGVSLSGLFLFLLLIKTIF
jgi:hypothetical protein